jgi:multidrug efflux pump subunit AcrA (membrane-fusion protein)
MKKIILFISVMLIFIACNKAKETKVKPIHKDITATVFASGVLEPNEKYSLTAQADGYLIGINFNEGDFVKSNQIFGLVDNKVNNANASASKEQLKIAELNTSENSPALLQLKSNIVFAEQKLTQELQQLKRYKSLQEINAVSKLEVENYQINADNAQSNLNALKQQYSNMKLQAEQIKITQVASNNINIVNQDFNKIKTLIAGKVLKRFKQSGDYVRKGDVIATIGNQGSIIAKLNVDENSISKVKLGQKVFIQLNVQKDSIYEGIVAEILPMFEEATQSFIVKVIFSNESSFKISGTQLEANIEVEKKSNALLIPRIYMGFGNKVKLKGKEELLVIKPGIISTEYVEVLEGLTEKDELVPLKP